MLFINFCSKHLSQKNTPSFTFTKGIRILISQSQKKIQDVKENSLDHKIKESFSIFSYPCGGIIQKNVENMQVKI
jgi:hypothetical protein